MSHKYVSNKAVMKNEGFLAKLGSTLMSRTNPDPLIETKTQSSITWRKTSEVKARIKTATGTIAIYDDMSPEEIAELEQQATMMAGGSAPELSGVAATAVQTAVLAAGIGDHPTDPNAGPANAGPTNARPANAGPANAGPTNAGPANAGPANDVQLSTDSGRDLQHDDEDDEIDLLIEALRPFEGQADQMLMDLTLSSLLDVEEVNGSLVSLTDAVPKASTQGTVVEASVAATPTDAAIKDKRKCNCCVIQ